MPAIVFGTEPFYRPTPALSKRITSRPSASQGIGDGRINRNAKSYGRYGSTVHKQVYIYGRLKSWADGAC
jgi:hypothetical protein